MTLVELLGLLLRSPDTLLLLVALLTSLSFSLGAIGTALEVFGAATGRPRLERFGQRIEALFSELPKLWRGSRAPLRALQGKDSSAAVGDNGDPPMSLRGL